MGMYDTIKVKYPLPDKEVQNVDFQTKDLDCELATYEITEDGQLIEISEEPPKKVLYSVNVTFYTSLNNQYGDPTKWYEYEADFAEGKIKSLKKISPIP